MLISSAAGIGSGLLNSTLNKPKQVPSTSSYSNTQNNSNSGYSQRILTDEQQQALGGLSQFGQSLMTNPGQGLAPIREGLRAGVNQNYAGADQALKTKLGRGDSRSGLMGLGQRQLETSRAQQLSGVDNQMAQMVLQQQDKGASLLERLLSQIFGQSYSGSSTQSGSGSSQGTQGYTMPGGLASGVGGGLDTLMTLMTMQKMLQGNNSGAGSSGSSSGGDWQP